jgi:hypothetical protein
VDWLDILCHQDVRHAQNHHRSLSPTGCLRLGSPPLIVSPPGATRHPSSRCADHNRDMTPFSTSRASSFLPSLARSTARSTGSDTTCSLPNVVRRAYCIIKVSQGVLILYSAPGGQDHRPWGRPLHYVGHDLQFLRSTQQNPRSWSYRHSAPTSPAYLHW